MNRLNLRLIVLGLVAALGMRAGAQEKAQALKKLDIGAEDVHRLEVSNSLGGFRNTLVFYTFKKQRAVLKVMIDNKSKEFSVSAMLYAFGDDVTEEGLKKWLNNQHSDGLYPDVPIPTATHKLAKGAGKVTAHKLIDKSKQPFGEFENYSVDFEVSGVKVGGLRVKDFKDKATVHLKIAPGGATGSTGD